MFNFMKKSNIEKDEKEKRKKEKEGKKKRERGGMTAEELLRLDEVRRSLKIRTKRKDKEKLPSGITADYSENFFADLARDPEFNRSGSLPGHTKIKNSVSLGKGDGLSQSDSSEASLNSLQNHEPQKVLPPLPPRPPKRGILKGSRSSMNSSELYDGHDPNSTSVLVRNTLQNELITYQNIPHKTIPNNISKPSHMLNISPEHTNNHTQSNSNYLSVINQKNNLLSVASTSPSAESLTDTSNSSFATPPFLLSPVGESQGFTRIHSSVDDKCLDLPLPNIIPLQLPKPRELVIHRTARGDFGFQLRRAIITDKLSSVNKKTVIFAEPGALVGNKNETGLLPGDILLEVNGIQVQDKAREEIIDLIKGSGSSVTVKVQPIPELCELTRRSGLDGHYVVLDDSNIRGGTLKRSGSLRFKRVTAKTEEDLANEKAWLDTEKLWLVHRGGFTSVRILPNTGANQSADMGKIKVKVDNTNEILEVDEDDLEKANPNQLDKIEDLSHLRYINESSVLYVLRQRFGNNLIHTYAAGNLIVINPQCTLSIYNEKVAALFRGCKSEDMPPHIYAMAQTTYRSMLSSRKDQSIVLLGRSGSGKTHNFRHILTYLLHSAGSVNKVLTLEKLNALNTILEAFGNARTCLNVSATRCTNLVNLDFDQTGQIASLSVQMLMLEKHRVAKRPEGEGIFNVFYWLLAGAESSLAKQLLVDTSTTQNPNLFMSSIYKNEDRQRATMELTKLTLALNVLGVSEKECFIIWSILAVIYHLGNAGTVRVGTNKWQFADPVHASKACRLLRTTTEELSQVLWEVPGSPTRTPSPADKDKIVTGPDALEGFVVGLYAEVVNVVNNLLNRCLTTNVHSTMSLMVVDSPGLQNPSTSGQQRGANFSDLCHNYVQERLHLLFHNVCLVAPHDRYTQEHVEVNTEEINTELNLPSQLVSILDKSPPSGVLKTSQTDLREIDRRGLLWLLEEESLYPNSSDETFLQRLFQHYGGKDHQLHIRKSSGVGHFVIQHLKGTSPVVYDANGLLKASKENPLTRSASSFLQESTKEDIAELFIKTKGGFLTGTESSQTLRRVSSIRRTCSVAIKRKSLSLQVKFTADSLIETLRRTRPRFVFCLLAHHNAGNTEIIPGPAAVTGENILNIPLIRSQIRGADILPTVRMFKQGFPEYFPHGEFKRRFRLLAPGYGNGCPGEPEETSVKITVNGQSPPTEGLDEARVVEEMLQHMDVDISSYRIGLTQVFFRAGVLAQLESQRDEKLADLVIQLQSRCRGYLARKKLAKLKVQDLAVRCIQRNVRKLMQVREWPWWRLYVKVAPLLNVHRTEEELTAKIQELDTLKATLEKLEADRNQLKLENDKLEAKLSEMTMDLSEERATGTMQAERLEAETAERVRLEQELSQIQNEKKNLQQASERLEMELFYARADVNGLSESEGDLEDGGGDAALYKNKCERAMRELEFTRRRLQQQHEDDLEQLVGLKKQLEKKLSDAYEEVDEQRQVAGQWKRKVQKLQSEMNDLRLLLEVQSSRNSLLEKKQRKFDSEIQLLQDELRTEKNQKEHMSREKEMAYAEKYSMEQNLSSVRLELELKEEKLAALARELEEFSRGGGTEQEVAQLRKAKHDLDMKLKEQEEELDELAGQVSMLEGNKLRLEMSLESLRKDHRREMAQRDDELDEARSNSQKKIKVLESQLESEHEERTLLLREKHELERRLANAEERGRHSKAADEDALLRARRDLKKTKALLRDAQVMLERAKQDSPSKAALRALKNQLEDAELARASAVKAKQSLDSELSEVNGLLEEALRAKGDAENRCQAAVREMNGLRTQVDENEEELAELLKKYRQTAQQLSAEQLANQETAGALAEAEAERQSLRDQLAELTARLEANAVIDPMNGLAQKKLEIRIKELESRLDMEQTTRGRLEVQITRLKENVERLNEECVQARTKEQAATDQTRKLQRTLRETKEDLAKHQAKEQEASHKRKELEKRLETAEHEASTARTDLRLAVKRIEDLQSAISGEIGSDSERTDSEEDDSGDDSLISHVPSTISSTSRTSRTPDLTPR